MSILSPVRAPNGVLWFRWTVREYICASHVMWKSHTHYGILLLARLALTFLDNTPIVFSHLFCHGEYGSVYMDFILYSWHIWLNFEFPLISGAPSLCSSFEMPTCWISVSSLSPACALLRIGYTNTAPFPPVNICAQVLPRNEVPTFENIVPV